MKSLVTRKGGRGHEAGEVLLASADFKNCCFAVSSESNLAYSL